MSTSSEGTKPFLTESKYRDSDVSEEWEAISHKSLPKAPLLLWLIASTFLLLLTNATTYLLVNQTRGNLDASCALYTLKWSPIVRDVNIRYETVFFNSTIYGDRDSVYRQNPSREVDEAWNALGVDTIADRFAAIAPLIITEEEAVKSGVPLDRVRLDEKDGGPGHPVIVEGLHNLHCMNLLHQALYFSHDKYHEWKEGAWKNEETTLQLHIGHCLNILRIVLMCNPDTGVHPFVWAKHGSNASYPAHVFPDFQRVPM